MGPNDHCADVGSWEVCLSLGIWSVGIWYWDTPLTLGIVVLRGHLGLELFMAP